ncbi:MAG TPA: hypothetical protein VIV11_40095 [Kofleriaceae bacterium]
MIPKLSELPVVEDPARAKGVLDSAHAQPGPEQQPVSKKARKAETAAATAAAVLGVLLSDHANVTLGGAAAIDENLLFEDRPERKQDGDGEQKKTEPPPLEPGDEALLPWIRLK